MSDEIWIAIGESLRDVESVDTGQNMAWGDSLRVRVHMNVTNPSKWIQKLS